MIFLMSKCTCFNDCLKKQMFVKIFIKNLIQTLCYLVNMKIQNKCLKFQFFERIKVEFVAFQKQILAKQSNNINIQSK